MHGSFQCVCFTKKFVIENFIIESVSNNQNIYAQGHKHCIKFVVLDSRILLSLSEIAFHNKLHFVFNIINFLRFKFSFNA